MAITIIPKEQQGQGAFNGGEIVENKPIGFPQDHSSIRPYSNLFYWAHAKAVKDSTIGLHPHQGFEICSFVLKGNIRHYDTQLQEWRPLEAGDVQIIRAGNGISHSEFMSKDAEIFQIWFDPNLAKTMEQPATYDDYKAKDFPVSGKDGAHVQTLVGEGSPFRMDTPGVAVQKIEVSGGSYTIEAEPGKIYSAYVLDGEALFNGSSARTSDFVQITDQPTIEIESQAGTSVFIISSLQIPGYRTYGELMKARMAR